MCCSALIDEGWARGCGSSWRQAQPAGLSFLAEAVVRAGRSVLAARGCLGCRGPGRTGSGGRERAGCAGEFAKVRGDPDIGPFSCASDKELMLFNVQNGSTVYTHRTSAQSITNVDEYLRALTPDATAGYASIYYANANEVSYSQHNNRYYVIAVTPLSGGGGGGM